jgi:hypothetical protein
MKTSIADLLSGALEGGNQLFFCVLKSYVGICVSITTSISTRVSNAGDHVHAHGLIFRCDFGCINSC